MLHRQTGRSILPWRDPSLPPLLPPKSALFLRLAPADAPQRRQCGQPGRSENFFAWGRYRAHADRNSLRAAPEPGGAPAELTPSVGASDARFRLISGFQLDFRHVALYFNRRTKGLRRVGQALENITRSRTRRRRRQAARIDELVVGVLVVHIGLALAYVVQDDRPK